MARDLTVAWELLTAVTRARAVLASVRPMIWEKARLPTAEHFLIVKPSGDRGPLQESSVNGTEAVVMRVSIETLLLDGRRLSSCLDILVSPNRWLAQPYIMLADKASQLVWAGQTTQRADSADAFGFMDSAARSLVDATIGLDFASVAAL